MDARLVKRCWFLNGDILPDTRPVVDLLAASPEPLAGLAAAGAKSGRAPLLMSFLPWLSLTLRPSPGLPDAFTGELAIARFGTSVLFFVSRELLDLRMSAPCAFPLCAIAASAEPD